MFLFILTMAKIKLNSEISSLFGKSGGSCFQTSAKGVQMKNNAHMRGFRTQPQKKISEYFISGTRHWRNLGSIGQANWLAFAEFLPQPQIRYPEQSISAYENFVKRNAYLQISNSDANLWMSEPALIAYEKDELSVLCNVGPVSISLDCAFVNADSNLDCLLFLSGIQSPGETYIHTVYRYMSTIANSSQQIDITVPFLSNFGNLPTIGSKLFFSVIFCGSDNGQFWFPENVPVITETFVPPVLVTFVFSTSFNSGLPLYIYSAVQNVFQYQKSLNLNQLVHALRFEYAAAESEQFDIICDLYSIDAGFPSVLLTSSSNVIHIHGFSDHGNEFFFNDFHVNGQFFFSFRIINIVNPIYENSGSILALYSPDFIEYALLMKIDSEWFNMPYLQLKGEYDYYVL